MEFLALAYGSKGYDRKYIHSKSNSCVERGCESSGVMKGLGCKIFGKKLSRKQQRSGS